jgi:hypothetical protein
MESNEYQKLRSSYRCEGNDTRISKVGRFGGKMENRNGGGDRGIDGGSAATREQRQHQKQKVKGGTSGKSHVPNDVCK